MKLNIRARARDDLRAILAYLADFTEIGLVHWMDDFEELTKILKQHPEAGVRRPIPNYPTMRMFPFPKYSNYIVYYRVLKDSVEIVRVLHGRRDIKRLLQQLKRHNK